MQHYQVNLRQFRRAMEHMMAAARRVGCLHRGEHPVVGSRVGWTSIYATHRCRHCGTILRGKAVDPRTAHGGGLEVPLSWWPEGTTQEEAAQYETTLRRMAVFSGAPCRVHPAVVQAIARGYFTMDNARQIMGELPRLFVALREELGLSSLDGLREWANGGIYAPREILVKVLRDVEDQVAMEVW